jgi:Zn-finger nucleic acid-binding protein
MKGGLIEWLKAYDDRVEFYEGLEWNDRGQLNTLLKEMSIIMSQLEHFRTEAHKKHNGIMYTFEGTSAKAKIKADYEVSELYQLRRIMEAGYRVIDAIRSNISSLNKES